MTTILSFLQVVISVVLIFLVLMHSGKDAGLSGAFGVGTGAGPFGGGSLVERNLNRWTIFFSVLFVINVIVLLKIGWAAVHSGRAVATRPIPNGRVSSSCPLEGTKSTLGLGEGPPRAG